MNLSALRGATVALALLLGLSACTTSGMGTKQTIGTLGGAAAGAALGAQFGKGSGQLAMVGVGTLLGAFLGNELGASLDRADQMYLAQAERSAYAAPLNQPIQWSNPQSGNYGTITPVREGRHYDGSYCREFQQTIVVGGRSQPAHGTACQQRDGSWRVMDN